MAGTDIVNLDYDPDSLGPFDLKEAREFEKWRLTYGYAFKLDESYLQHLPRYYGGRPRKKCFRTQNGRERAVERFLNFVAVARRPDAFVAPSFSSARAHLKVGAASANISGALH